MNTAGKTQRAGFSLVEVTLALGVVTFCLIALVGLLPVGLDTVKVSNDEAAVINCMEQIAVSIRRAQPKTDEDGKVTHYEASGAYRDLKWPLSEEVVENGISFTLDKLSPGGFPSIDKDADVDGRQYVARVTIYPPANLMSTGAAKISVAWPAHATWNPESENWQRAQGKVDCWLVFLLGH
jgi:type II secretory pathway pseudopilin PulG